MADELHQTTTRIRTRQLSEFRTVVLELPNGAPEVPLPYGAGLLVPTYIRIHYDHYYPPNERTTARARVFGSPRQPGKAKERGLVDVEFTHEAHWVPEWVTQLMRDACPIGWTLS